MKNFSDKLVLSKNGHETEIAISANISKRKFILLLSWFILWSFCGMIVFSQFFVSHTKEIKLFMFIWFIFWIYFEYKIGYVCMWRKTGKEIIRVNKQGIIIKRDINGHGRDQFYSRDEIKDFKIVDFNSKNFTSHMQNSFWVIGGETLRFNFSGKAVTFGMQLSESEAQEVYKQVKFALR